MCCSFSSRCWNSRICKENKGALLSTSSVTIYNDYFGLIFQLFAIHVATFSKVMKTSPVCTRTHSYTKHNQLYLTVELFQHLWVVVLLRILMKGNHTISLINACIYIPIFYLERKEKYHLKTSKGFINTLCMYFTHRKHHEIWRRALRFRTCVKNFESLDVVTTADQNEGKCITKSRGQLATSAGTTCSAGKRETQSCDGF